MKKSTKTLAITSLSVIAVTMLSACVNQNIKTYEAYTPVTNPCQKIDALINAYDNNFDAIKQQKTVSRVSSIWKAKYHLIGNNCQIWSWGTKQTTYSCHTVAPNEEAARSYYLGAVKTAQQCLGNDWQLTESSRINDSGLKTEFINKNNEVILSTHIVPSNSLFSSEWSVYYYVGNTQQVNQQVKKQANK